MAIFLPKNRNFFEILEIDKKQETSEYIVSKFHFVTFPNTPTFIFEFVLDVKSTKLLFPFFQSGTQKSNLF